MRSAKASLAFGGWVMGRAAVDDEHRAMMATVGRGNESLRQMGLGYPGGDSCPTMVLRGLAKLRMRLGVMPDADTEEASALQWIDHWLDAGASMLPKGSR